MADSEILITGGTSRLGKYLLPLLDKQNLAYITGSRQNKSDLKQWQKLDLESGEGLEAIMQKKKTIFHLASATQSFNEAIDVEGTKRLLQEAKKNKVEHFIYISITGVDKIPYSYYEYKLKAEEAVKKSGVPYSILRATQFHDFVDTIFNQFLKLPIAVFPKKIKVQPIDTAVVAEELLKIYKQGPSGSTTDIGGPEILEAQELAKLWLNAQDKSKMIMNFSIPGDLGKALVDGALTCPDDKVNCISWEQWLKKKYA